MRQCEFDRTAAARMPQGFRNLYRRHRSLLQLFQHPPLGVIQDMGLILGLVMGLILVPHPRHLWVDWQLDQEVRPASSVEKRGGGEPFSAIVARIVGMPVQVGGGRGRDRLAILSDF